MNASITFLTSPWLLLLIIPLIAVIFALVFVRKKRGIVTANLILSATLQCMAILCFIFAISGIAIAYDEINVPKEAVVLVDTSYSASSQQDNMNDFVHDVLTQSVGRCQVGVVLFGDKQKVALNMTEYKSVEDVERAYQKYINVLSETPKGEATDVGSALKFVWDPSSAQNIISNPSRARVVILSDGLETDGDALGAVKQLIRDGVQLETSFYADNYLTDTSILEVGYPQNNVYPGDKIDISIKVKSSVAGSAELSITDKDKDDEVVEKSVSVSLQSGVQNLSVSYSFEKEGFHQLSFYLKVQDDREEKNNVFCSYFEVARKNKILVLEKYKDESKKLNALLEEVAQKGHIEIEIQELQNAQTLTVQDLVKYNEVILYNSTVRDMQEDFQRELNTYVDQFGGGLFTVGGFEKDDQGEIMMTEQEDNPGEQVPALHSYNEGDLQGSILADMLPVRPEAYKPAVAVVFVVDISSSMTAGKTSVGAGINAAAEDARYIIDYVLEQRDYAGLVTLQETYAETLPLTPMTKKEELKASITELEDFYDFNACTKYAPALQQAKRVLDTAPAEVARKHIILLSDGSPGDSLDVYGGVVSEAYESGITLTVVTYYYKSRVFDGVTYYFNHSLDLPGNEIKIDRMKTLAGYGGGSFVLLSRDTTLHGVAPFFKKDLKLEQLAGICYKDFTPKRGEESNILDNVTGTDLDQLTLNGYFSSRRKIGTNVCVPLLANGAPLYAEWTYGKGKVGSIMIDLEGKWSGDLLNTNTGQIIVKNIITSLLMTIDESQTNSFEATISEDNLHTQVNIFNLVQEEDPETKVVAMVQSPRAEEPIKFDLGVLSNGCRFVFENSQRGVYTVYVMKVPVGYDFLNSNVTNPTEIPEEMLLELVELHRAFSYSKEYDGREDPYTTGRDLLTVLSTREAKDGIEYSKFIYDAEELFVPYGNIHRVYDLRQILLICAMVLYLVGIILRLFKIKPIKHKKRRA